MFKSGLEILNIFASRRVVKIMHSSITNFARFCAIAYSLYGFGLLLKISTIIYDKFQATNGRITNPPGSMFDIYKGL